MSFLIGGHIGSEHSVSDYAICSILLMQINIRALMYVNEIHVIASEHRKKSCSLISL